MDSEASKARRRDRVAKRVENANVDCNSCAWYPGVPVDRRRIHSSSQQRVLPESSWSKMNRDESLRFSENMVEARPSPASTLRELGGALKLRGRSCPYAAGSTTHEIRKKKTRNGGVRFCANTPIGCPFSLADNLVGGRVVDGGFPSSVTHLPLSFPSTLRCDRRRWWYNDR